MKRLIIALCFLPSLVAAQLVLPDVQVSEPSELDRFARDPANWVLIAILAMLVVIGALLWVRWKPTSKD